MYCMNCGTHLPDSANFCLHCGTAQRTNVVSPIRLKTQMLEIKLHIESTGGFFGWPKGTFNAVSATGESLSKSLKFEFGFDRSGDDFDIYETPDLRQILGNFIDTLSADGWQLQPQKGKHWYSFILQRQI